MALSAAERMRRYRERIKSDPDKHKEYCDKEKKRYRERRSAGKLKTIPDLDNERDKRLLRRRWRLARAKERENKRQLLKAVQAEATPPPSPTDIDRPRAASGRNRIRRDRTRSYRKIKQLEAQITDKERLIEKYRKQSYRLRVSLKGGDSPRSKTSKMLKGHMVSKNIRKSLLFHNTLSATFQQNYTSLRNNKIKRSVANILKGRLMKKYRLINFAKAAVGISKKVLYTSPTKICVKSGRLALAKKTIHTFFNRDDVSRVKAGKKEFITRHKLRKQKRLLNDTLKNLHLKLLAEDLTLSISYSMFCRLRPFWVLLPSLTDRETCQCKLHANAQLMVDRLHQNKVLPSRDLEQLIEQTHCDSSKKACMYGECNVCENKQFPSLSFNPGEQTWWFQWQNRLDERLDSNGGRQSVKKIVKTKEFGTLQTLKGDFHDQRKRLSKHIFNIRHQYKMLRNLRDNLPTNAAVIHIDFSENYSCKYNEEIQSVHFSGSREQVSLHTGVAYTANSIESFCTLSASRRHDPPAIWAHLEPVVSNLTSKFPEINNFHFVSDGPTTQYRCRKNFFLFSTVVFSLGARFATWNFLEAGHGKGPADGIGSVLKRTADRMVAQGTDIVDVQSMYDALSSSIGVSMWLVQSESIDEYDKKCPDVIPPVPGTMSIHQVITDSTGEVRCRAVSCFCGVDKMCDCHNLSSTIVMQELTAPNTSHNPEDQNDDTAQQPTHHNAKDQNDDTAQQPTHHNAEDQNDDTAQQPTHIATKQPADDILDHVHPDNLSTDLIGGWCVVEYDGLPYPGIIQDIDDGELEVKVMHKVGNNRYFWPTVVHDVLWYPTNRLITLMPQTEPVTGRHQQIKPQIYMAVAKYMKL